jgi:hypothetical protein
MRVYAKNGRGASTGICWMGSWGLKPYICVDHLMRVAASQLGIHKYACCCADSVMWEVTQ